MITSEDVKQAPHELQASKAAVVATGETEKVKFRVRSVRRTVTDAGITFGPQSAASGGLVQFKRTYSTQASQSPEIVQEELDGLLAAGPLNGIREIADDEDMDFGPEPELTASFQTGTVAILMGTFILLTLIICRNTTYCRRKQADRAARREERQTRRAYKSAARRLRWRQWWEGWDSGGQTPKHLNHDLPVLAQPGPDPDSGTEADLGQEPHAMRNEILDFWQTFMYVGQLVQNPKRDLEGASPTHSDSDRETAQIYTRKKKHSAPASTAGLSTVISLDTNSLLSLETTSSMTLDTLETLDTAPPSYHS